ncbi:MAG: DnaD domain protein, partial [Clostridia bacterium]|nr:DnaD domain protein [Clostridia bacterium]
MREVVLTPRALSLLFREKDGGAVRLYLYYLSSGALEPEEAMTALSMGREEYAAAYARLVALELLPAARRLPEVTPPAYTREEIAGAVESDAEFRELLAFTEQKLGRIASNHEVETLLALYHWMGLPCGVIMLIVSYCAERAGEEGGRRLTVSQIQKTANKWSDQGIDTTEKADSYLRTLEKENRYLARVRSILSLSALTPSVEAMIRSWCAKGVATELVERAADISAVKFGVFNMRYINGILRGWHEKGLYSLADVEAREGRPAGANPRAALPREGSRRPAAPT